MSLQTATKQYFDIITTHCKWKETHTHRMTEIEKGVRKPGKITVEMSWNNPRDLHETFQKNMHCTQFNRDCIITRCQSATFDHHDQREIECKRHSLVTTKSRNPKIPLLQNLCTDGGIQHFVRKHGSGWTT